MANNTEFREAIHDTDQEHLDSASQDATTAQDRRQVNDLPTDQRAIAFQSEPAGLTDRDHTADRRSADHNPEINLNGTADHRVDGHTEHRNVHRAEHRADLPGAALDHPSPHGQLTADLRLEHFISEGAWLNQDLTVIDRNCADLKNAFHGEDRAPAERRQLLHNLAAEIFEPAYAALDSNREKLTETQHSTAEKILDIHQFNLAVQLYQGKEHDMAATLNGVADFLKNPEAASEIKALNGLAGEARDNDYAKGELKSLLEIQTMERWSDTFAAIRNMESLHPEAAAVHHNVILTMIDKDATRAAEAMAKAAAEGTPFNESQLEAHLNQSERKAATYLASVERSDVPNLDAMSYPQLREVCHDLKSQTEHMQNPALREIVQDKMNEVQPCLQLTEALDDRSTLENPGIRESIHHALDNWREAYQQALNIALTALTLDREPNRQYAAA